MGGDWPRALPGPVCKTAGMILSELPFDANRMLAGLRRRVERGSPTFEPDADFTGAMGGPSLDGPGVRSEGWRTIHDYVEVDSLPERARLTAGLLTRLQ